MIEAVQLFILLSKITIQCRKSNLAVSPRCSKLGDTESVAMQHGRPLPFLVTYHQREANIRSSTVREVVLFVEEPRLTRLLVGACYAIGSLKTKSRLGYSARSSADAGNNPHCKHRKGCTTIWMLKSCSVSVFSSFCFRILPLLFIQKFCCSLATAEHFVKAVPQPPPEHLKDRQLSICAIK